MYDKEWQRSKPIEVIEEEFGVVAKGAPEVTGPEDGGTPEIDRPGPPLPLCAACCSGGSSTLLEKEIEIKL